MPLKSVSQKQDDELKRQDEAVASANTGPAVTNYGTIAPDIIKQAKVQDMESRMTNNERKQYHAVRTAKYGYPPVK